MDSADNIRRIKAQAKLPKQKKQYKIPRKSAKKIKQEIEGKVDNKSKGGKVLERWFNDRRKEMTGRCMHCGGKSCKNNPDYWLFSIAHILPKRLFKSVATHPLNWIELCYFSPSCHANFDNYAIDITELNCYDTVIERFVAMYTDIHPKERKYIPDALLQYVKNEKDI